MVLFLSSQMYGKVENHKFQGTCKMSQFAFSEKMCYTTNIRNLSVESEMMI